MARPGTYRNEMVLLTDRVSSACTRTKGYEESARVVVSERCSSRRWRCDPAAADITDDTLAEKVIDTLLSISACSTTSASRSKTASSLFGRVTRPIKKDDIEASPRLTASGSSSTNQGCCHSRRWTIPAPASCARCNTHRSGHTQMAHRPSIIVEGGHIRDRARGRSSTAPMRAQVPGSFSVRTTSRWIS